MMLRRNHTNQMKLGSITLVVIALCQLLSATCAYADENAYKPLFDGKTLDGWTKAGGGATFRVEDAMIVAERGPGPNTFLRTKREYHDFELRLEFKFDEFMNSGVQFRSHQRDGNGRVFGYQCEIDPSDRKWAGGLYEEARRGWLYPLADQPEKQNAFKKDEWNQYVIRAEGPHIQTWVNGVHCVDYLDAADMSGFIALQAHSGKAGKMRWRNVEIKELGKTEWKPLFDGKTLDGWKSHGPDGWKVEDGVIRGVASKDEPRHGLLMSNKSYKNFAVRFKFKVNKGNSGFYFRSEPNDRAVGITGFQAEVEDGGEVGGLYETAGRAWVAKPDTEFVKKRYKPGDWNEMTVIAIGTRIAVKLNGFQAVELMDDKASRSSGVFAFQLHGNQDMDVAYKDIEVIELD